MMKYIRKITALLLASILGLCSLFAQTPEAEAEVKAIFAADPSCCVNTLHCYEAPEKIVDTPAPRGYKPFYVSHYGRHGSRTHHSPNHLGRVLPVFDSLSAHNLLTEEGEAVYSDLKVIAEQHSGLMGYLTHKGAEQHQGIAHNLYERYPQVFNQKDRREIYCVSTPVQRCIQSMANFCLELGRENPKLEMTMDAGERYQEYLCNHDGSRKGAPGRDYEIADSLLAVHLDPSRILGAWFTDAPEALKYIKGGDVRTFIKNVVIAGGIEQNLDTDPDILRHFTVDELYAAWCHDSVTHYNSMCSTVENGRGRDIIGQRILRDIVEKADEALAGNDHAADLRFGHDTGLSPLLSLLRVEGLEEEHRLADAPTLWYGFRMMPMASSLQLIFYRNKKGDVLVKLLRNECETTIPALPTVQGPYYDWTTLREYFLSLL